MKHHEDSLQKMSVYKRNIAANFGGNIWSGLMSLIFIPLYIRYIGIEAYGLVGVFATLQALVSLLDLGLGNTINRELSRLVVLENKAQDMRDLLRTLEIPYWVVGLLIGIVIAFLSPLITYHWVNAEALSSVSVQRVIIIMGLVMAFQWPLSFYSGGLMGLQHQVLLNEINAAMATLRGLGAVIILWLVSPTVEAFFLWQSLISIVHTGLFAHFLWRRLPRSTKKPKFRRDLLINIWRFAAGVTGISVLATILTQLDKVILSRMLSLEMFGYYSLANVVAMNLYRLIYPIVTATYPKLSNLVSIDVNDELIMLYHKSAQLVSVASLPVAVVVSLFSKEILLLWTRNPSTANQTYVLVTLLIIGTAVNGLMNIPYSLQMAFGWTRLAFMVNLVSVLALVPLIIGLTNWYGAVGAACVWVILNGGYVLFAIPIMHKRLIPTEKWRWYLEDIGLPLVASLAVAGIFRLAVPVPGDMLFLFLYLALVSCMTLGAAALATSVTRCWVQTLVSKMRVFHASNP